MTNRAQITRQAARDGLPAPTVERDYVLAHIIAALGASHGGTIRSPRSFRRPALSKLRASLASVAQKRAETQFVAHERVRATAPAKGRVAVEPELPVDLLGTYVLLPPVSSVREPT